DASRRRPSRAWLHALQQPARPAHHPKAASPEAPSAHQLQPLPAGARSLGRPIGHRPPQNPSWRDLEGGHPERRPRPLPGAWLRCHDDASDPRPRGGAARPLRDEVVELYSEVVGGSDARIPADIAEMLPLTLWLYQMGILYFWIFDKSPGRLRTLEVIDETTDLIVRLISLANLPVL